MAKFQSKNVQFISFYLDGQSLFPNQMAEIADHLEDEGYPVHGYLCTLPYSIEIEIPCLALEDLSAEAEKVQGVLDEALKKVLQ